MVFASVQHHTLHLDLYSKIRVLRKNIREILVYRDKFEEDHLDYPVYQVSSVLRTTLYASSIYQSCPGDRYTCTRAWLVRERNNLRYMRHTDKPFDLFTEPLFIGEQLWHVETTGFVDESLELATSGLKLTGQVRPAIRLELLLFTRHWCSSPGSETKRADPDIGSARSSRSCL